MKHTLVMGLILAIVSLSTVPMNAMAANKTVKVTDVQQADQRETWKLNGEVVSLLSADISTQVSGRILSLKQVGDKVNKGDVIVTIEKDRLLLNKELIEANIGELETSYEYWTKHTQRLADLTQSSGAAKQEHLESQRTRDEVRYQLQAQRVRLKMAKRNLSLTQVKAPFDGTITNKIAAQGQYVTVGEQLLHLLNPQQLSVKAYAPLYLRKDLKVGLQTLVAGNQLDETSKIDVVIPQNDISTRMIEVRMRVAKNQWMPGEPVEVTLQPDSNALLWQISRDAVVKIKERDMVAKITVDQTTQWIEVDVIAPAGQQMIVKSTELALGDKIIIVGGEGLKDGQAVNVL